MYIDAVFYKSKSKKEGEENDCSGGLPKSSEKGNAFGRCCHSVFIQQKDEEIQSFL